jgi:hypothetical protein
MAHYRFLSIPGSPIKRAFGLLGLERMSSSLSYSLHALSGTPPCGNGYVRHVVAKMSRVGVGREVHARFILLISLVGILRAKKEVLVALLSLASLPNLSAFSKSSDSDAEEVKSFFQAVAFVHRLSQQANQPEL